jgi:multiple sugar transport system permease protein
MIRLTRHTGPNDLGRAGMAAVYFALWAGALVMLTPLAWMVLTSLKSYQELFLIPPKWIPEKFLWGNYVQALTTFDFGLYLRNTLFLTAVTIAGTLASSCMAAYGFATLHFRGKGLIFGALMCTLMLPPQITIIPLFKAYASMGWINTFLPLVVPAWLGTNIFAIFLLRQFFLTVPRDYAEAARIDGASEFQILLRVFVPMCTPALLTIAVFTFVGTWNDLWGPVIFLHTERYYTMAIGLLNFILLSNQPQGAPWNLIMAVSTVMMAPIVVIFFLAQKRFIEGMSLAGLKG